MNEPDSYLYRVFRATELLNKQAILDMVEARPGGVMLDCGCGDGSFTTEIAGCCSDSACYGSSDNERKP